MAMLLPSIRGGDIHLGNVFYLTQYSIQRLPAKVRVSNLATTKEDGDSDTLAPFDKSPDIADLVSNIMGVGMGPHLDFFYDYEGLLLFCPVRLLPLEVAELPVVHDAAHRWLCLGGHLNQIQTLALHRLKGVSK